MLGAAGATVGATAGGKVERDSYEGLPEDEIFVYEDALRKGRSVVIALAENDGQASLVRDLLHRDGAESVDAAREQWWIGLRSDEHAATQPPAETSQTTRNSSASVSRRRCMRAPAAWNSIRSRPRWMPRSKTCSDSSQEQKWKNRSPAAISAGASTISNSAMKPRRQPDQRGKDAQRGPL